MPKFGQVLGTECENLLARRGGSKIPTNVYANAPDQRRILHAGHP